MFQLRGFCAGSRLVVAPEGFCEGSLRNVRGSISSRDLQEV